VERQPDKLNVMVVVSLVTGREVGGIL
jgi:hypothetical protein